MPNTEIYKIPGRFNTPPEGWPRMTFPELDRGLIEDWVADDLGDTFPRVGWVSRVTSRDLVTGTGSDTPAIVTDARGHKAVRFSSSVIRNNSLNEDWQGELTVEVVINPTEGQSNGGRVISGPSGAFRAVYIYPSNFSLTSSATNSTINLGGYTPGQTTSLIARYGNSQSDGKVYGRGGLSSKLLGSGPVAQPQFFVGANSANPPSPTTFIKADIYRIRVWNRLLSDGELDIAMMENAEIYGF